MPPKRKALTDSTNQANVIETVRRPKALKTSANGSVPASNLRASVETARKTFKYSLHSTLSKKPKYMNLQWPNFHAFINDKNQDVPKPGELMDEYCYRVSDLGIPVSEDGMKLCEKLDKEDLKRNQEHHGVFICSHWNGYGISEVMQNFLKDFNRDIFKMTLSPYRKWAYVEALAVYLKSGDFSDWTGGDDSVTTKRIIDMFGVMLLTCFDMLSEHNLFNSGSQVKNIEILSLILLEFLREEADDFDCEWGCEVVRLCDEVGINLAKEVRKQVSVSKKHIGIYRTDYEEKKKTFFGEDHECNGNGYQGFAKMKGWKPEMDMGDSLEEPFCDGRMWYRWDWALEYEQFKKENGGGTNYDLSNMTKAQKREHAI